MKRGRKPYLVTFKLTCDTCGSVFERKENQIKEDQRYFFCSRHCAKNRREGKNCLVCERMPDGQKIHHDRHAELLGMLDKNCLTYTQIGERFGVTRERIRQIAKILGFIGHDRRKVCTVRKRLPKTRWAKNLPIWESIGLDVKPVIDPQNQINGRRIIVNGKRCAYSVRHANPNGYTTLFRTNVTDCDFQIVEFDDGRWLVVPKSEIPNASTTVKLVGDKERFGYARNGKPWQDYINNWSPLLRTTTGSTSPRPKRGQRQV